MIHQTLRYTNQSNNSEKMTIVQIPSKKSPMEDAVNRLQKLFPGKLTREEIINRIKTQLIETPILYTAERIVREGLEKTTGITHEDYGLGSGNDMIEKAAMERIRKLPNHTIERDDKKYIDYRKGFELDQYDHYTRSKKSILDWKQPYVTGTIGKIQVYYQILALKKPSPAIDIGHFYNFKCAAIYPSRMIVDFVIEGEDHFVPASQFLYQDALISMLRVHKGKKWEEIANDIITIFPAFDIQWTDRKDPSSLSKDPLIGISRQNAMLLDDFGSYDPKDEKNNVILIEKDRNDEEHDYDEW
jgi:hypothetical protein